jgi:hypothetical protein
MTEMGLFSTNLSNTSPSIGASFIGRTEEALAYTKSPHLYTAAREAYGPLLLLCCGANG